MRNWQKKYPPYEGDEPYLYLAFAEADTTRVWRLLRMLLGRGCRVWYSLDAAGGARELLHRQSRAEGAALTVLYLSDAACADRDTKGYVLVNQKFGRPIVCIDPDGADRRLFMGLRETTPHIPLYSLKDDEALERSVVQAPGFSQDLLGPGQYIPDNEWIGRLSAALAAAAVLALAVSFAGWRWLGWFRPPAEDRVIIADEVLRSAVRQAGGGGSITEELTQSLTELTFSELPESWDELSLLPALETLRVPQEALLDGGTLPEGDYRVELTGGGG